MSLLAAPAGATIMVELDLDELIAQSDAIVHAEVERTGTQMADLRAPMPMSVARLRVREWLAGHGGTHVVVRDPGARWAAGEVRVDGAPRYRAGEEVIAFLRQGEAGYYRTFAMAQGKFVVERRDDGGPDSVGRDLRGVSFARFLRKGLVIEHGYRPNGAALEIFLAYVRQRVRAASAVERSESDRVLEARP